MKEAGMIPKEALDKALEAWCETPMLGDALMNALEAAAPYLRAQALSELTANSPRLPSDIRNAVFEIVFDVANKFHFPMQNCGPRKDVVEAGDVCGDVEKRIVALLRARAVAERGEARD